MNKLLPFVICICFSIYSSAQTGFYFDGLGWQNNTPSGSTGADDFYVVSGSPTISSSVAMRNLEVSAGTSITISGGTTTLTVNGILDGSGSIRVTGGAQLVQTGSGSNTYTGGGSVSAGGQFSSNVFNLVSSPVTTTSIPGQFGGANPCDMFVFDASSQSWGWDMAAGNQSCRDPNNFNSWITVTFDAGNTVAGADGVMDIGRGYTVAGGGQPSYRGQFNNGNISIGLSSGPTNPGWSGNSWNLIGNPYPSSVSGSAFVAANTGISGTLYFWDDDGSGGPGYDENSDFATWNTGGGVPSNSGVTPNGSIAIGQGFFVSGTGTASFTNAMRGGDNSQFFKTASAETIKRVWLNAINDNGYKSTILMAFTDSASQGYDRTYDGERFIRQQSLLFGTQINQDGCYIIQSQNNLDVNDRVVDLMLRTRENSTVSISLDHFENFYEDKEIIFLDTETGKSQNLANGPVAVYLQAFQNYEGRFKLLFKHTGGSNTTSIDEVKNTSFILYQQPNVLTIDFNGNLYKNVSVFSLTGQKLFSSDVDNKTSKNINTSLFTPGIYVIQLTDQENKMVTKKVGIN